MPKAIWDAIEHHRWRGATTRARLIPIVDGDEPMLGLYLIMAGYPPEEEGVVLPFAMQEMNDERDPTE